MISLQEAFQKIDEAVKPLAPVALPLDEVTGCTLAETVTALIPVPGFDNSAMDGIAIRYDDLEGEGPWMLPLQDTIAAGSASREPLAPGHAVKIMTGAPMAPGADTVIKVEELEFEGGSVKITDKTQRGKFVRPTGDDIQAGDLLYEKGTVLTPIDAGVLASVGLAWVRVHARPKIALLFTGSELVEPGTPLTAGKLYNSNLGVLRGLLQQMNLDTVKVKKKVADDPDLLAAALEECMAEGDLVITTGGVSMGDFDFLPQVLRSLGGEILFHKVKVKPGKPALVACVRGKWLICLPGNPVSVTAAFHCYVKRALARLMGTEYKPCRIRARLAEDLTVKGHRLCVVGARLEDGDGEVRAYPARRQKSGRLSSIQGINAFLFIPPETRVLKAGDPVEAERHRL